MRYLLPFLFVSLANTAFAQCNVASINFPTTFNPQWDLTHAYADGGFVGTMQLNPMLGDLVITKVDPQGLEIWTKRVATTDARVELVPTRILALSDGGVLVIGLNVIRYVLGQQSYFVNSFGIRLDAQGDVIWARYFMYDDLMSGTSHARLACAESPGGDLWLAFTRLNGFNLVQLAADGSAAWERHYDLGQTSAYNEAANLIIEQDGDVLMSGRYATEALFMKVDAAGALLWAKSYGNLSLCITAMVRTSTGDYLLARPGTLGLLKTDADGNFTWRRSLPTVTYGIGELANGEIVLGLDNNGFAHLQADGTPVARWDDDQLYAIHFAGVLGNEVIAPLDLGSWNTMLPGRLRGPVTALNCALDPLSYTNNVLAAPTETIHTATVAEDTLNTWTMSLGEPVELNQLDLAALVNCGWARPGFEVTYSGRTVNLGGLSSGPTTTTLTVDPSLTFVSGTPVPTNVNGNVVTWNSLGLGGFAERTFIARFDVPVTAVVGSIITATLVTTQGSTEVSLTNNTATVQRVVTSSYDPNDKLVSPEGVYHIDTDSVLNYTIRFQNTGTDTAFTVVLVDSLPPHVHASTFIPGPSTHPYTYTLTGAGILTFRFEDILLPDSTTNEPASHGFVSFTVEPEETLLPGTEIRNRADIFFDFNPAVRTPDAVVVIEEATALSGGASLQPQVLPNPASDLIQVVLPDGFVASGYRLSTTDGRLVRDRALLRADRTFALPVHNLEPGVYHLWLRDAQGKMIVARFFKE